MREPVDIIADTIRYLDSSGEKNSFIEAEAILQALKDEGYGFVRDLTPEELQEAKDWARDSYR